MAKKRHIVLWIIGVLIAALVLSILGANRLINTRWAREKLNSVLSTVIDGRVEYSHIDVSLLKFPICRVTVDTVALTYDHWKFSEWDGLGDRHTLLSRGRGTERDTLARFDRLSASCDIVKLLGGRIRVKEVTLDGFEGFVHFYDSTASNLKIILPSDKKAENDTSKSAGTQIISVGNLCIPDLKAVYTDQARSMYAEASMGRLDVSGHFRIDDNGEARFRGVSISIDSLFASARIPSDSARVSIRRLDLSEPYKNVFNFGLDLLASADTKQWGNLSVPAVLDGRVGLNIKEKSVKLVIPGLDGRVAHIPFHIDGNSTVYADSSTVALSLSVKDCPLDTLLSEYGVKFIKDARKIRTDAHADIDATAKGKFYKRAIPDIKLSLKIPGERFAYLPLGLDGKIVLDADGTLSSRKVLDVNINGLEAKLPGLELKADGSGRNILGGDPDLNFVADAFFSEGSLTELLPKELGISADGNTRFSVRAKGRPTEFAALDYQNVSLSASLEADNLAMHLPKDTLDAAMYRSDVKVLFGEAGSDIQITTDSLTFIKGEGLRIKARGMKTRGSVSNVETASGLMPHISLSNSDAGISLRAGNNWFIARDVDILTSATKRARLSDEMRAKLHERMERDSLERSKKSYRKEKAFEEKDIKIAVDTTILRYLRQWNPVAKVSFGRTAARMPALPLRTRIGAFTASFDGDIIGIDTLSAIIGSSDIEMKGKASGLRRFLRGRGDVTAQLATKSKTINANELLAAFSVGSEMADSSFSESDESFVIDTLDEAQLEEHHGLPLVVLPGNISATMNFMADTVYYTDYAITPLKTRITMRERTAQMLDTKVSSNLGDMTLSAFYSARNKEEISAGIDIGVYEVSADSLIRLIPKVDSLMPVLKSFQGRLNCEVTAQTQLDTNMTIETSTLEGVLRISGKKLNVADAGDLRSVTRLLRFRNPDIGHIDDLSVNAVIHDNKIDVFPFVLGVDRYKMALHGMQRMDRIMYYHASVLKSPFLMRFGVNLFGTVDKWGFTIGRPKYFEQTVPDFSAQIDTMQTKIRRTIYNVFEVSDEDLVNSDAGKQLRQKANALGYDSDNELLEESDAESSEQAAFEYDAMVAEEELHDEVDAILEESFRDIADMMSDYENQVYEKKVLRKMERLEKKQAKKKKK